jgi:hypothetical protein
MEDYFPTKRNKVVILSERNQAKKDYQIYNLICVKFYKMPCDRRHVSGFLAGVAGGGGEEYSEMDYKGAQSF